MVTKNKYLSLPQECCHNQEDQNFSHITVKIKDLSNHTSYFSQKVILKQKKMYIIQVYIFLRSAMFI